MGESGDGCLKESHKDRDGNNSRVTQGRDGKSLIAGGGVGGGGGGVGGGRGVVRGA